MTVMHGWQKLDFHVRGLRTAREAELLPILSPKNSTAFAWGEEENDRLTQGKESLIWASSVTYSTLPLRGKGLGVIPRRPTKIYAG